MTAIKIDLKLGNDQATLTNVLITGALTYLGGDGNNNLILDGAAAHTYGSISVTNGDGADIFRFTGTGDLAVTGAVTISNGEGKARLTWVVTWRPISLLAVSNTPRETVATSWICGRVRFPFSERLR